MKKILTVLAATAALFSGLMFTGCSDDGSSSVVGANKWFTSETTNKDGTDTLSMYFYYTDSDTSVTGMRSDLTGYEKGVVPAGLTVVIYNSGSGTISGLANNSFVIKTFKNDTTVAEDGSETTTESSGITVSETKWTAMYVAMALKAPKVFATQSDNCPVILTSSMKNTFTAVSYDSVKENFNWKTILANILLAN